LHIPLRALLILVQSFAFARLSQRLGSLRPQARWQRGEHRLHRPSPASLVARTGLLVVLALLITLGPLATGFQNKNAPPEAGHAYDASESLELELSAANPDPTVDTMPPATQILRPADGSLLEEGQVFEVAVSAEDADGRVSEVDVSLDGGRTWQPARPEASLGPRTWRLRTTIPEPGNHQVLARAIDRAGNIGPALRPVSLAVEAADSFSMHNPYAVAGTFRAAQLHDHTANSFDGDKRFTPDVKSWYLKEAGYSVVVYTDHDRVSESSAYSDQSFQVFPGYESTGPSGHVSAWFVRQVIDQRLPVQQRIDAIRAAGGIAALNHPEWSVGYNAETLQQLSGYRALEIVNWLTTKNESMLRDNLEKWRQVLNAKGPKDPVWGVAVGDSHGPQTNTAWTRLKLTDLSEASIRAAIENGAMYGSNGPDFETIETKGERISVVVRNARYIRFFDSSGAMVLDVQGQRAEYSPNENQRWVRIEASDDAGHTAWSQPLWIVPNSPKMASMGSS
jgi:hypothetical protein